MGSLNFFLIWGWVRVQRCKVGLFSCYFQKLVIVWNSPPPLFFTVSLTIFSFFV
uniref:Candidate secreted effector n=1 Tax=Meloidogyne incognita TaxID=6306 RepID=A0A914L963_MELIC